MFIFNPATVVLCAVLSTINAQCTFPPGSLPEGPAGGGPSITPAVRYPVSTAPPGGLFGVGDAAWTTAMVEVLLSLGIQPSGPAAAFCHGGISTTPTIMPWLETSVTPVPETSTTSISVIITSTATISMDTSTSMSAAASFPSISSFLSSSIGLSIVEPIQTTSIIRLTTSTIPNSMRATHSSCLTQFLPGSTPSSINNAILSFSPFIDYIFNNYFGFTNKTAPGSTAESHTSSIPISTWNDQLAFYPSPFTQPTGYCNRGIGYFLHIPSGLCITGKELSSKFPRFQGSTYSLQKCNICSVNGLPVANQRFCDNSDAAMAFMGDVNLIEHPYYAYYLGSYESVPAVMEFQNGVPINLPLAVAP